MGLYVRKLPQKATEEEKRARKRKKKTKQTITRAVTHIRLIEANSGKLDALDQLATTFQALCQQYVTSCAQRGATLSVARERDLTQVM